MPSIGALRTENSAPKFFQRGTHASDDRALKLAFFACSAECLVHRSAGSAAGEDVHADEAHDAREGDPEQHRGADTSKF